MGADRPPWEWTDAERLALLTDDAAAAERVRTNRASWRPRAIKVEAHAPGRAAAMPEPYDIIVGKRDPHLLFAWELFDVMVAQAFADNPIAREAYRGSKEEHRRNLQLPEDFWERLESITAPYRADRLREREIGLAQIGQQGSARIPESTEDMGSRLCRSRYAAIVEAQRQFGPVFIRFLYDAVTPGFSVVVLEKPGPKVLKIANGECE